MTPDDVQCFVTITDPLRNSRPTWATELLDRARMADLRLGRIETALLKIQQALDIALPKE